MPVQIDFAIVDVVLVYIALDYIIVFLYQADILYFDFCSADLYPVRLSFSTLVRHQLRESDNG